MYVCTTADLGPEFIAWVATTPDGAICLVSPRVHENAEAKAAAVEMIQRHGLDPGQFSGCPESMTASQPEE